MSNLVDNPKARFDYELLERFEAGLELLGSEVKSLKLGRGKLAGGRVLIRGGEAYLVGARIDPYQAKNLPPDHDPERSVRLLLTKKELKQLAGATTERGLTLIPLSVYNKGGRLKLALALARGKKKFDKRQKIKQRETNRELRRTLKSNL